MRVAILAAGGLSKVISEALELEDKHSIVGFFDDKKRGSFLGYPVIGKCSEYKEICRRLKIEALVIGFGYYFLKQRLFYYKSILKDNKLKLISAIHPKAVISAHARIGRGVYIGPGVIINPGASIGNNSVIWSGTIIEHDNFIGENVFIAPGVRTAGYAEIGDNSFIGMGTNIAKVKIGKDVTVGAASLVLEDVKSNKYVLGIPAKIIRTKKKASYV